MKYVLPLMLAASAAWAANEQTPRPWIDSEPPPVPTASQPEIPSWMAAFRAAEEGEPVGVSHAGECPRDMHGGDDVHDSIHDDPHALVRASSPDVALPTAPLSRSGAANGHDIAELFAKRALLSEQLVRVHAVVVKKTEGILGKTYLHVRDGTGSPRQGDDDLTVTTTEAFEPGEAVELEGRVRIDQDLGLGYRYAVLLDEATRVHVN
jgi:hypothetical protein